MDHKDKGNIFIHPFNPQNLKTTSYDVTIGKTFFRENPSKNVFNPFDVNDIKRYWGHPQQAVIAKDWMESTHIQLSNINPNDEIIVLAPGEFILAHTNEFIGGRNCVTSEMRAKSSMGRIGITVCKCAGWGSVGFCNRWTMEISNGLKESVILVVGMRVAQIIFYQVDDLTKKGNYVSNGGLYQDTDDTQKMMDEWTPCSMLPKFSEK